MKHIWHIHYYIIHPIVIPISHVFLTICKSVSPYLLHPLSLDHPSLEGFVCSGRAGMA